MKRTIFFNIKWRALSIAMLVVAVAGSMATVGAAEPQLAQNQVLNYGISEIN